MRLNFDFTSKLVLAAGLLDLMLKNDFERYDVPTALLSGQIDVAKFAFAKRFANLKVVQAPFFAPKHIRYIKRQLLSWTSTEKQTYTAFDEFIPELLAPPFSLSSVEVAPLDNMLSDDISIDWLVSYRTK